MCFKTATGKIPLTFGSDVKVGEVQLDTHVLGDYFDWMEIVKKEHDERHRDHHHQQPQQQPQQQQQLPHFHPQNQVHTLDHTDRQPQLGHTHTLDHTKVMPEVLPIQNKVVSPGKNEISNRHSNSKSFHLRDELDSNTKTPEGKKDENKISKSRSHINPKVYSERFDDMYGSVKVGKVTRPDCFIRHPKAEILRKDFDDYCSALKMFDTIVARNEKLSSSELKESLSFDKVLSAFKVFTPEKQIESSTSSLFIFDRF